VASPVGHSLFGAIVALLLGRPERAKASHHPLVVWLPYAALANLPDIDFLVGYAVYGDPRRLHSGFTHSLLFCLVVSGLAALLRLRHAPGRSFLVAFALLGSHLLLDMASGHLFRGPGYGVMLFFPFSTERIRSPIALFWGPKHKTLADLFGLENLLYRRRSPSTPGT
jgi:inner membrane protein